MSPSRLHARRPAAALILMLAACRPAGRSEPAPPHQPAEVTPARATADATPRNAAAEATPPPATPGATGTIACEDPVAAFARFAWLPAEVHALVSVQLLDHRLPRSLDTLAKYARGRPSVKPAAWTNFAAEVPDLRALLTAAKLSPDQAVYFLAGPDVGVWTISGSCEPELFAQIAAALKLEVRQAPGPTPITIATGPAKGRHFLVHRPEGGQLWIARADQQAPLLAWIHGLSGGSWDCCEQDFQRYHSDATVRVFLLPDFSTFRQYSITGSSLVTSAHLNCFVTPIPKPE